MRPLRLFPSVVLLMCLAAAVSSAQEERALIATHIAEPASTGGAPESALSSNIFTLTAEVEEVQVRFVATDRTGRPIPELQARDIKVVADGKFSPEIKSFGPLRSSPITLGIVVDLSESVRPEMHLQVMAFSDAVSQFLQSSRDREFAVAFSNRVSLIQPPTSDFSRVRSALEHSPGDNNLTSLYDAIVRTCREQYGPASDAGDEQRILLLFSDGLDNLSINSLDDAVEVAVSKGVAIYAVAQQGGNPTGRRVLEQLTQRTGGTLELLRQTQSPDLSVASVRALSGDEYLLSFRPPNDRPGFHPIELKAAKESSIVIHSRRGYYLDSAHR